MAQGIDRWHTQDIGARTYVEVGEIRGTQAIGDPFDYGRRDINVDVRVFLDLETGLVTFDPGRFEEWLEENRLTPKEETG